LVACELEDIPLSLEESYMFAVAPVNLSQDVVLPTMIEVGRINIWEFYAVYPY